MRGNDLAVSVVMPSLNQGRYLGEAVRSVLSQGPQVLELIVMDGGSTDDSPSQLADLAGQFPGRVRWYSGADGGPAEAVNRAVRLARGEIIGWLNSDDLYARGAVKRAVRFLKKNPASVMVYGKAHHLDAHGKRLGEYPTRSPDAAPQGFVDGCFICQPSAFFRRHAFEHVGGLDVGLRTAFDFDLWLRLFKQYPDQIGFISRVQAFSRLHDDCITQRFRERVAFEGIEVVSRHLGVAPLHWLLTHYEEVCAAHPFASEGRSLSEQLERIEARAADLLTQGDLAVLSERRTVDRRVALSSPELMLSVYPDGWAGRILEIRALAGSNGTKEVVVQGRNVIPGKGPLSLRISSPDGSVRDAVIEDKGDFELRLPLTDDRPSARMIYRIHSSKFFVPSRRSRDSDDSRELSYLVDRAYVA